MQEMLVKQTSRPEVKQAKKSETMTQTNTFDLVAEIHHSGEGRKYDRLVKTEPSINWLGFVSKLYSKSDSIPSVVTYVRGVCKFKDFLESQTEKRTLADLITAIKQDKENKVLYHTFSDFATWCHSVKRYKPATTWVHMQSAKKLFDYLDIEIDDSRFEKKVTMPTNRPLREEYPPNDAIRKIIDASSPRLRVFEQVLCDTGFEPVDAAKLKASYFKFDEDPVRILIEREKTSEPITTFINDQTAEGVKMLTANKGPDDYVFCDQFTQYTISSLRSLYNGAAKRAGLNEKISGHRFGKYHLKIYKKRWFTLAISAGVPEYVVQGMLGRKKYLDQYMALPLEDKRAFAKKILKIVSIYADKASQQEVLDRTSEILGMKIDENTLKQLKEALAFSGQYAKLPDEKREQISKILGGASD
jgi:hypothetical protein